jgi:hypothetical protein
MVIKNGKKNKDINNGMEVMDFKWYVYNFYSIRILD